MRNARAKRDEPWLARAVQVAARGLGATYPNPSVGAVVVKRGIEVGSARSAPTGGAHAEIRALAKAGKRARGATLYVTLEPCAHHGRTPPCTDAIVAAGIKRVVVGVGDPAAHVQGRGLAALVAAGIDAVVVGDAGAARVHEHYLHQVTTARPFVTLKSATSLDGRIATASGDSKWITGEPARRIGHRLRAQHHGVAVGVQTVLADNPRLDVRLVRGADPTRIVFDSRLRLSRAPSGLHILAPGTWVIHTSAASARARAKLQATGVELIEVASDRAGRVRINAAMKALARRGLRSVLVEGGGTLVGSFVQAKAWNRWFWFQAAVVLGDGAAAVAGLSVPRVAAAPRLTVERRRRVGDDWLTVLGPPRDGA